MAAIRNQTKDKLAAGELALGFGVRLARSVEIAKVAKVCGFDWLFVDLEHNGMGIDTACQMCAAALDAGITPIPRASGHHHFLSSRLLDNGAQGVVVPHVNSAEEARHVVDNCRYPPIGHRSVSGGMAQLEYENLSVAETVRLIDDGTLVTVMIESPAGVAAADAIAAVPGVDVLLIGTNDLCAEMGIPGQFGHDRVAAAYDAVGAACRNNGKAMGMGGVYDEVLTPKYVGMGARMILAGNDLSFLMGAAKGRSSFLKGLAGR